jgi:hypothetical protein
MAEKGDERSHMGKTDTNFSDPMSVFEGLTGTLQFYGKGR